MTKREFFKKMITREDNFITVFSKKGHYKIEIGYLSKNEECISKNIKDRVLDKENNILFIKVCNKNLDEILDYLIENNWSYKG